MREFIIRINKKYGFVSAFLFLFFFLDRKEKDLFFSFHFGINYYSDLMMTKLTKSEQRTNKYYETNDDEKKNWEQNLSIMRD